MKELKCPNCGNVFKVDESDYSELVKQIHTHEFEEEINERIKLMEEKNNNAVKLAEANVKESLKDIISNLEKEKLELENALKSKETENKLALTEAVNRIEKERDDLKNELKLKESEKKNIEISLKEKYDFELKSKEEQIEYYKDLKLKLSTKMLGETLEQHCEIEFEKIRATGFKNAKFGKDSDVTDGTKGDYVYRESDEAGNEIISIMFEMKNENEGTSTKQKNEDFLKKLDKDRNNKNCEYAVLVSMLEAENEIYNTGIVDKGHIYPKMYVVRPQFFIPIITILRNAALNAQQYKAELAIIKEQNIDISNFENELDIFKDSFGRNYGLASRKFKDAIDQIDRTIKSLEKTKDDLLSSENNLRIANDKAGDLSIKRLTRNNPTMAKMFDEVKGAKEIDAEIKD